MCRIEKCWATVLMLLLVFPTHASDRFDDNYHGAIGRSGISQGISSASHGTVSLGFTPTGVIRDCDAPSEPSIPHRIVIRTTYEKLDGVCDDRSAKPCSGRFVRLEERCTADDVRYAINSEQGVDYASSKWRLCYDASAQGNCDEVDMIAKGRAEAFIVNGMINSPALPDNFDATSVIRDTDYITWSKRFRFDGRPAKLRKGVLVGSGISRINGQCLFVDNACATFSSQQRVK